MHVAAPRWWYLLDRRIIGGAALAVAIAVGGGAFAAFRPTPPPPPAATKITSAPGDAAKAGFITEADRLCSRATGRIKALTFPTTQVEAVAYVTAGIAITRDLLGDLKALDAPKQDRRQLRKVLRGFGRSLAASEDYLVAVRSGNPAAIAAAERRAVNVTIRANGRARAYGFGACAEGA